MSDDDKNGAWNANAGITLPEGIEAIYNAGLSPLFITRNGRVDNLATIECGTTETFWTQNVSQNIWAYYITISTDVVWPSNKNNSVRAQSLRCLVSTNNG